MPFALITIGLLVIVSAVRNTLPQLAAAVKNDFSGSNNFFYWIAGIGVVGSIGYIPAMRTFSRIFLALLIIVLALHNGGFFSQFMSALQSIQAPPASSTDPATGTTSPTGQSTGTATAANNSAPTNGSVANSGTSSGAISGMMQGLGVDPGFANFAGSFLGGISGF